MKQAGEVSSKELNRGEERGCLSVCSPLAPPYSQQNQSDGFSLPRHPLPQAGNPWVPSVSLRAKSETPLRVSLPSACAVLNARRGCQDLKLRHISGTLSAPFIFRENWFVAARSVSEPAPVAAGGGAGSWETARGGNMEQVGAGASLQPDKHAMPRG